MGTQQSSHSLFSKESQACLGLQCIYDRIIWKRVRRERKKCWLLSCCCQKYQEKMTIFTPVRKSLVNALFLCACIFVSLAEPHDELTLTAASVVCSAVIQSNGSIAVLEMLSNVSTTTIHVWNGFARSLSFSMCTTISLDIHLRNSTLTLNLNQNEIRVEEIQLSASRTIFQNGTCILGGSAFIPKSSILELHHVTFVSPLESGQILLLTVLGMFLLLISKHFRLCVQFVDKT